MNLKQIDELSKKELLELLPQIDEIIAWAKSVKEYCLSLAQKGEEFKGWKLVNGRSIRKWISEEKVKEILLKQGLKTEDIYDSKLMSPTKIEKIVGKAFYEEKLEQLVDKPLGAPTLVPDSDVRSPKTDDLSLEQLEKIFK